MFGFSTKQIVVLVVLMLVFTRFINPKIPALPVIG